MLFTCICCCVEKTHENFYKDKKKKTGFRARCKECEKLLINKESRRAYEKSYWDKRRDIKRKIVLNSYYKNEEHHKEKRKEYLKTENGQMHHRKDTQNTYAKNKNIFIEIVDPGELYRAQKRICYICNGFFEFNKMECDHVIPISKGGMHTKTNVKIACSNCNKKKGAKLLQGVVL